MMKKYLIICLLAGITGTVGFAQKAKADKLFTNKQYYAAAQAYEQALNGEKGKERSEILLKTGLCYLNINRPQAALLWLKQLIDEDSFSADVWYQYGLALQLSGNYGEAIRAFEKCLQWQQGHRNDADAMSKIASCRFAIQNNPINPYTNYRLATEINTAGSEFGISFYTNDIVYYSVAGVPADHSKADPRTGLQYVEAYMAKLHNKRLLSPQLADNTLSRYISSGLFTYDSISRCAYFSYCNPDDNKCGIYYSQYKGNKWTRPEIILQDKRNQVSDHPAITNGGERLYFTSNSPEGIGRTDIWYIDRGKDGRWGQPVNAGNIINTPGREAFPYIFADTLLFFSSDGHAGYGGLDIFCSIIRNNTFQPPINLRRPYNSNGDDFNLVISGNTGLMSSSRNELVSDDIYLFEGIPSLLYLSGKMENAESGKPVNGARITLSIDGKAVQHVVSDSSGYYGFFLREDDHPMIYVRATGYKPALFEVAPFGKVQFAHRQKNFPLQPSNTLPVTVSLYDKTTGEPITERGIICFNNDGETQILRTDEKGAFNLPVQEDQKEYWVKFPDGYYLTESVTLNDAQRTYSLDVQPLNQELFAGWLRFKRGSTELTEISQPLIPYIAAIIRKNPGMVFRITGFSDSDTEGRLPELARQRAEYIVHRMVERGVEKQQLIIDMGNNPASKNPLTEEQKEAQRKVEIRVQK
jgi:tetratricopeptide (TPR) repeat protein/outer membrane protein OmpA-like peptidoglycan-associated protein